VSFSSWAQARLLIEAARAHHPPPGQAPTGPIPEGEVLSDERASGDHTILALLHEDVALLDVTLGYREALERLQVRRAPVFGANLSGYLLQGLLHETDTERQKLCMSAAGDVFSSRRGAMSRTMRD
jgi:hypothetical protein